MCDSSKVIVYIPNTTFAYLLITDSSELAMAISHIYHPYARNDSMCFDNKVTMSTIEYYLCNPTSLRVTAPDVDEVYMLTVFPKQVVAIISQIIQYSLLTVKPHNLFHGAAVNINGKTVVFFGKSGTGKSTFITYLLHSCDCSYIAEDVLNINYSNNKILPFPRPLHLRADTPNFLNINYGIRVNTLYSKSGEFERSLFIPSKYFDYDNEVDIDLYVMLSRSSISEIVLKQDAKDKRNLLLHSCFLPRNLHINMESCIKLSNKHEIYELSVLDLSISAILLNELTRG